MGARLGWDAARVDAEIEQFGREARSEGIALALEPEPA
jgi:hypothetical protein